MCHYKSPFSSVLGPISPTRTARADSIMDGVCANNCEPASPQSMIPANSYGAASTDTGSFRQTRDGKALTSVCDHVNQTRSQDTSKGIPSLAPRPSRPAPHPSHNTRGPGYPSLPKNSRNRERAVLITTKLHHHRRGMI